MLCSKLLDKEEILILLPLPKKQFLDILLINSWILHQIIIILLTYEEKISLHIVIWVKGMIISILNQIIWHTDQRFFDFTFSFFFPSTAFFFSFFLGSFTSSCSIRCSRRSKLWSILLDNVLMFVVIMFYLLLQVLKTLVHSVGQRLNVEALAINSACQARMLKF